MRSMASGLVGHDRAQDRVVAPASKPTAPESKRCGLQTSRGAVSPAEQAGCGGRGPGRSVSPRHKGSTGDPPTVMRGAASWWQKEAAEHGVSRDGMPAAPHGAPAR